jgi:hypothetical protein
MLFPETLGIRESKKLLRTRSMSLSLKQFASTMPARINFLAPARSLPFRPRCTAARWQNERIELLARPQVRWMANSNKTLPVSEDKKGPNTETLPHVSEEAAAMSKTTGGQGPELEQGTPVQEVRLSADQQKSYI